ncbi:hypothetical protein ISS05_01100, partial [Candidatus Woesearchaeota archaeon]|nr:hypothetical protein [Candidatus Woesearchaeota archaeon]
RKKIILLGGVGFKGADKGIKRRKTVCGHKINEHIIQINLKVTKEGAKKLTEIFGAKEAKEEKKEEPKKEVKEEKPEAKEEKKEEPKKEVKEEKTQTKEEKKPEVKEEKK